MKIILIIFVFVTFSLNSQVSVLKNVSFENNKKSVSMYPSYTMFFKSKFNKTDTVFIGIEVDSINSHVVSPKIYSFMPKGEINTHSGIQINFIDGSYEWFPISYKDNINGFIEYNLSKTAYKSLCNKKMSSILIGVSNYYNKEYDNYFIDFLKLL